MALLPKLIGAVAVATYMFQTGLATPKGTLAATARRGKRTIARGLFVMLVLGPVFARLLAEVLALGPRAAAALVLLSLVGVVPLASRSARSVRGDVAFAVVVTAALGLVAAFTAAPATRLLLGYEGPLELRTGRLLLQLLLLQAAPLALGVLVRTKTGRTPRLEKALGAFNALALVALFVAALVHLPRYGPVRSLGWNGALAALVYGVFVASASYALGGPDQVERRTLAALANMPNVILALLLVTSAGVDAGFAVAVIGVFLVRVVTGLVLQMVLLRSAGPGREVGPRTA